MRRSGTAVGFAAAVDKLVHMGSIDNVRRSDVTRSTTETRGRQRFTLLWRMRRHTFRFAPQVRTGTAFHPWTTPNQQSGSLLWRGASRDLPRWSEERMCQCVVNWTHDAAD